MRRKGLSYLEVLIAAGIALTGILGAIAIYPVAIMNMRKGQTVDIAAAIGPSVLNSKSVLHIDDPAWWVFNGSTEVERMDYPSRPDFQGRQIHPTIQPFDCFCFDPRFVASVATWDATQNDPTLFPSVVQANALDARMRRLTLAQRSTGLSKPRLTTPQARLLFKCQDDLLFERPTGTAVINGQTVDEKTMPARQFWLDNGTRQRRDYFADFEFIVTACPKTEFESGVFRSTGQYDVAAVVFRERTPDLSSILTWNGEASVIEEERVCDVAFLTPGYNGGDVTITTRAGRPVSDLNCVQSSWALVSGVETVTDNRTQPATVGTRPVFQWYRVTNFTEVYGNSRDLTLDGPDWLPNTSSLRLTLCSGVVAVFNDKVDLGAVPQRPQRKPVQ